jgi:hypothetical protein
MTPDTRGHMPRKAPCPSLAAFGIALALAAPSAWSDPPDELTRLREEAAQLRQSLEGLEARIQALEAQRKPSAENAAVPSPSKTGSVPAPRAVSIDAASLVTMKQNWSRVEAGTPEAEVRALLGEPQKVLRIDGNLVWYYAYPGIGRGSVFFNRDGKVSSTQSPSLGW